VSQHCPKARFNDLVRWRGMVGIVDSEWSQYDPTGEHKGWRLVLFEGGFRKWGPPELIERLSAVFVGMPNERHYPNFNDPIESWREIPHGYDEYLTWGMNAGCMFCGLPEDSTIHINKEA
jgi:hypothetical protein